MRKISECYMKPEKHRDLVKEYDFAIIFNKEFDGSAIYNKNFSIHRYPARDRIEIGGKYIGRDIWMNRFYRRIKPRKDTKQQP